MSPATTPETNSSLFRRWRDGWRDRRLARLPDRAFCRRVSLEGWHYVAAATEQGRGLLITLRGDGLPRTAARALRLFAAARPAAELAPAELAAALTAGAVIYAPAGEREELPPGEWDRLEVATEATAVGARITVRSWQLFSKHP